MEQCASLQAKLSSDSVPIGNLSVHNQPSSQTLKHSVLSHSCYHHCLFSLNYCFSPRAQTPSQVLPVRAAVSPPTQLLRHAITCIQWGNIAKTHSQISPGSIETNLWSELDCTLEGMCMCMQTFQNCSSSHNIQSVEVSGWLSDSGHSGLPSDFSLIKSSLQLPLMDK